MRSSWSPRASSHPGGAAGTGTFRAVAAARAARIDLDPAAMLPPSRPETAPSTGRPAERRPGGRGVARHCRPGRSPAAGCCCRPPHPGRRRAGAAAASRGARAGPPGGRPTEVLASRSQWPWNERTSVRRGGHRRAPRRPIPRAALRSAASVISPDDEAHVVGARTRPEPRRRPGPRPEPDQPPPGAGPGRRWAPRPGPAERRTVRWPAAHDAAARSPGTRAARACAARACAAEPVRPEPVRPHLCGPSLCARSRRGPRPSWTSRRRPALRRGEPADPATTSAMPAHLGHAHHIRAYPSAPTQPPPGPRAGATAAPRPSPGRSRRPPAGPAPDGHTHLPHVVPNPIPLARRNGPAPIVRPLTPVSPSPSTSRRATNPSTRVLESRAPERLPVRGRRPADDETPAFHLAERPTQRPAERPLLAPLLDPTIREDDPLGVAGRSPPPTTCPARPRRG